MQALYSYYTDTYMGTMPEAEFDKLIRQAEAYVDAITFNRVNSSLPSAVINKVYDAECAIADILQVAERGGIVSSASNDGYSETYAVSKETIEQRKHDAALLYLGLTGLMFCGGLPIC